MHKAVWYSVIFDETTDYAHETQLTLAIRYVYRNNVHEDFVDFLNPRENKLHRTLRDPNVSSSSDEVNDMKDELQEYALSGEVIGKTVIKMLKNNALDPINCIGIATDGCSTMVSQLRGAVVEVQKIATEAVHCPCYNHALNLCIAQTSEVRSVRNSIGLMKNVIAFFGPPKRNNVLKKVLGKQLLGLCETRWIERHESIIQFCTSLPLIVRALETISGWKDSETASKAHTLTLGLSESSFIVTLLCLADVLSITLPLSRLFQKKNLDLISTHNELSDVLLVLEKKREDSTEGFQTVFQDISTLAEKLGTIIRIPRTTGRQTQRDNYDTSDPETYYRLGVFNCILDYVVRDMKARFPNKTLNVLGLSILVPSVAIKAHSSAVSEILQRLADKYFRTTKLINSEYARRLLSAEFQLWVAKWAREKSNGKELPSTAIEALSDCDTDVFPSVHNLLKVFASLPISVATAERSFSTLRRLKTWMRSVMTEDRLVGLALMTIHRTIAEELDEMKVIERFAQEKNRRLPFVL